MMVNWVLAPLGLAALYVLAALVFWGVGGLVPAAQRAQRSTNPDPFLQFWLGWVVVCAVLLIVHLFLPLAGPVLVAGLLLLGAIGSYRALRAQDQTPANTFATSAAVVFTIGLAVAFVAMQGLAVYDHGLYHAQTLQWWSTHPVVPGLGNLHGRLAFNSSAFAPASLLHSVLSFEARHVAMGAPTTVLISELCARAFGYFRKEAMFSRWTAALMLAPTGLWIVRTVGSVSTDLPVYLLGTVLGLRMFDMSDTKDLRQPDAMIVVTALAAGLVTIKLSGAILATAVVGGCALVGRGQSMLSTRTATRAAVASAGLLAPWMIHGIIQSGYPMYPAPFLGLPLDFRVPITETRAMARVINDWAWSHLDLFVLEWSILLPIPALLFVLLVSRRRLPSRRYLPLALVAAAVVLSLAIAPDPRFAGAGPWLLFAGAGARLFDGAARRQRATNVLVACGLAFTLTGVGILAGDAYRRVRSSPFPPRVEAATRPVVLDSGLTVHVPLVGDRAYWAPLPSVPSVTQDLKRDLRLRTPGDLSSGFTVREPAGVADDRLR